jgi:hypothetical protein
MSTSWRTGVIQAAFASGGIPRIAEIQTGALLVSDMGEDHFAKTSKPCSRNILVAASDVK